MPFLTTLATTSSAPGPLRESAKPPQPPLPNRPLFVITPHSAIRPPADSGEIQATQETLFSSCRNPHLQKMRQCRTFLMRVFTTRTYERAVQKLLPEADRSAMEAAIVADPGAAPVIQGTGGLRKLRWAGSGRGKRGGIRTIYFRHARPDAIYLLAAYAKADREDLSPADRRVLSRLVAAIKKEERSR